MNLQSHTQNVDTFLFRFECLYSLQHTFDAAEIKWDPDEAILGNIGTLRADGGAGGVGLLLRPGCKIDLGTTCCKVLDGFEPNAGTAKINLAMKCRGICRNAHFAPVTTATLPCMLGMSRCGFQLLPMASGGKVICVGKLFFVKHSSKF